MAKTDEKSDEKSNKKLDDQSAVQAKVQAKVKAARNNWDPLSSRPGLDFAAFVTSLIVIGTSEFALGLFIQIPIHAARVSMDHKQLAILYAAWVIGCLAGFYVVTNTFMKRWATIFDLAVCPWWMKALARILILSPLLSIWATLFTLMFAKDGVFFRDGEKKSIIVAAAVATLLLFHVGVLGWRLTDGQIKFSQNKFHLTFHLTNEVSVRDSFRNALARVRPANREATRDVDHNVAHEVAWLPGDVFSVHFYPYLSPLTKLMLSLYGDFVRTKTMADAIEKSPKFYCSKVPSYLELSVPNCFLTLYREMAKERAFVSPAFGLVFETMYRKSIMKDLKPTSPMESFGLNAIAVDNLVTLLEPGDLVFDRRQFIHPIGFLVFYGSPEIPAIALGQDLQHFALSTKLLPLLAPQLAKLSNSVSAMKGALTPAEDLLSREKLAELGQRIKGLASDPLALQPLLSPPPLSR